MRVSWIRSLGGGITFRRPSTFLGYGIRGSGKSSLLEHVAENYLANGSPIIDLFGSRDGEGLAWCRSPWAKEKKILLLHGDNTSVASSFDSKNVSRYTLADLSKYDIIISASPLYSSIDQEYKDVNRILDSVYQRLVWKKVANIIIREAANLLYSRLKVSKDQNIAKAKMAYFIREARHTGFAVSLDTLKFTSVDIDIRVTIDYIFFKSMGIQGLPADLRWLYSFIKPFALQKMRQEYFVCLTSSGSIGIGIFPEVPWHKDEGEDILKACGVEVDHGDELIDSKEKFIVGDLEHIIFIGKRVDGVSYADIAGKRWSSQTILNHIISHNADIDRTGGCLKCRRGEGPYSKKKIPRRKEFVPR